MTDISLKDDDLLEAVVHGVTSLCGCDFTEDYITDGVFQCFPSSPQAVTYHAQLHSTNNISATQLLAYLQQWASSDPFVPVQFLPLTVDGFCAVPSSVPIEQCLEDKNTTTVAITVSCALGLGLLMVIIIIGVTIARLKSRHQSSLNLSTNKSTW